MIHTLLGYAYVLNVIGTYLQTYNVLKKYSMYNAYSTPVCIRSIVDISNLIMSMIPNGLKMYIHMKKKYCDPGNSNIIIYIA